jgi:hypothetical protein
LPAVLSRSDSSLHELRALHDFFYAVDREKMPETSLKPLFLQDFCWRGAANLS